LTWLYLPSQGSPSAQASPGSNSESPLLCQGIERSVMSRGRHMRLAYWQRAWRTRPYLRRLSGPTSEPSTAARGAESWISLLRATRASLSRPPAVDLVKTILATCGPMSRESSLRQGLLWSSAKTSPLICPSASIASPRIWKGWAIGLRLESSVRQWSGRPTSATGCSGLRLPTPMTPNGGRTTQGQGQAHLETMAYQGLLPTPGAQDTQRSPEAWEKARRKHKEKGVNLQKSLLVESTKMFLPTPTSRDHKGGADWSKRQRGGNARRESDKTLPDVVEFLPTPTAGDSKGSGSRECPGSRALGGMSLTDAVTGSAKGRAHGTGGKLRPQFVEWMMGWPTGWTDCEPVAMESFRSWRREHSFVCSEN